MLIVKKIKLLDRKAKDKPYDDATRTVRGLLKFTRNTDDRNQIAY